MAGKWKKKLTQSAGKGGFSAGEELEVYEERAEPGGERVILRLIRRGEYTGARVNGKEIMVYIGAGPEEGAWAAELNGELKMFRSRDAAEMWAMERMRHIAENAGRKAAHMWAGAKAYEDGENVRVEWAYGSMEVAKIDKVGDSYSAHVLGRPVWVYPSRGEAVKEARGYFIRFYIEREFAESPWGDYMGEYKELVDKYAAGVIGRERYEIEKRGIPSGAMAARRPPPEGQEVLEMREACEAAGRIWLAKTAKKDGAKKAAAALRVLETETQIESEKKALAAVAARFERGDIEW